MTTTAPTHTARRPDIEAWLDELGATWRFDPDVNLAKIDQAAGLANQVRHEPLNAEVVERYTASMMRGDVFPPLLMEDLAKPAPLGGNHRLAALHASNQATTAAYLITAPDPLLRRIRFEDNARHGWPATTAERIEHAVALMADGMSQRDAARIVGVPQPKLSIAAATFEAGQRADTLGIDRFARLPEGTRYSLGQLDDDTVFEAAAQLTVTAALPAATVKSIVRAAQAVEPAEALRIIGAEAEDHHQRTTERAGNVRRSSRTARARLEAALAEIKALTPIDVYDTCPNDDVRAVLAQRIREAAAVLAPTDRLLRGQEP